MAKVFYTNEFEKEVKLAKKRGKNLNKLHEIIRQLANEELLHPKYRNHKLQGSFKDRWELHIEPDWLLIYKKDKNSLIFERTGTHSDLFE